MTGSFDSLKKTHSYNEEGKPKLERLNAKKNIKYVPQNEDSPMSSSPAHINRIVGTITGDFLTSFRLLGNNLEEEIENICRSTGISRQEFVGGIPQESWQSVSEQRKYRSGPLLSDQKTPLTDSVVHLGQTRPFPAQKLDPWSRGTSYFPVSPLTTQNQPSEHFSGNSHRNAIDSAVSDDSTYFVGHANGALSGGANTAASKSAPVAPYVNSEAAYQDKQDCFLDSMFHAHHETTMASSSNQHIYRPDIKIQTISELNAFLDNDRASYPLTTRNIDTAISVVEIPWRGLPAGTVPKAPILVDRIEVNLQSEKSEYDQLSHLSPVTPKFFPQVLEISVPATSGSCLEKQETCPTSHVGLPEATPYFMGQENISMMEFPLVPESKSSNAVCCLSENKDGIHEKLATKEIAFQERTEDCYHEHLPVENQTDMAATVDSRLVNRQTATSAAEEQTTLLNEELSRSVQTVNYLLQSHMEILVESRPRIPWSFWRKGDFLGSGSFGTVYEGVNSAGLFFAVKEVSLGAEGRGAQESISQLEQEIEILRQFQHEYIVQYLGTQREQHTLYIFLEFMTKGALSTLYKKIPLFDSQIRSYTRQILCGLKYLHEMDIVHRDIKCANILVHANGTVKLADFGMARVLKKSEQLNSCKGSAYWMAPEVINPKKAYSFPADIWSLGCTVLEMATGSLPFGNLEWNTVLWKVGNGEIPPIPDKLQDDVKDFIRQCLQVDPALRPTADVLLEHPFIKSKKWHITSIHSSMKPVLVATYDSLAKGDSIILEEPHSSESTSSYSSSDSSVFGDDEPKVSVSGSKFSAHSVRTRRSTRMLQ